MKVATVPILNVKISAKGSPAMTRDIADILIDLTTRILHKDPKVTSIAIDYVDPEHWIVAGKSLVEHRKTSVYFDIKITDETNSKAEKAQYIHEAFEAFASLLGDLHEESYIYVQDVRATAYGYGGRTQEYRYHQG
jgi:4-oxalocrotonate tautomerase